jgi:hypothetical protein
LVLAAVAGVCFFGVWRINAVTKNGEFFEKHVVPGRPDIEIRIYGFVDAGFNAYIVDGWRRKKIFDSLECYAPDVPETTNSIVRKFQGKTVQREKDRNILAPMYAVMWSDDTRRVGIAFRGHFVAAYDRRTGEKIQFADYLKDMHVKDRNGSELWHDYRQCDSDIERFLRE